MPSPFIGGRIPQELHEALQNHIAESGEKLPRILQRALSSYLSYTPPISKSHTGLEERIASLEASFNSLKEEFEQMKRASPPVEIKEEGNTLPGQLSFLDSDNVADNRIDIKKDTDIKSVIDADNKNISEKADGKSADNRSDNSVDNDKGDSPRRVLIGTMKTVEILNLPGLQGKDSKKIKSKVNNAKQVKNQTAQIDPYTIVLSKSPPAEGKKRQELFWDVYEDKGESVIGSDNSFDN
jgi:hypothetical protein